MAGSQVQLPNYPSSRAKKSLTPSQLSSLNDLIATSLSQFRSLPPAKRDVQSALTFITSYCKEISSKILGGLIWDDDARSTGKVNLQLKPAERTIHVQVLLLSENLAEHLKFQHLVDLSITYGSSNPKRIKNLFTLATSKDNNSLLTQQVEVEVVRSFTTLLKRSASESGLYGLRKASHVLLSCLKPAPTSLRRPFAQSREFFIALATAYEHGLYETSRSYGTFNLPADSSTVVALEDWQQIFLSTKVALMDSFHIVLDCLFTELASISSPGSALAAQSELAFDIITGLQELPPLPNSTSERPIPFFNRSLLADYQHAYNLSSILSSVLKAVDAQKLNTLENELRAFDLPSQQDSQGALKFILRSSGAPPGIDARGSRSSGPTQQYTTAGKGKAKATVVEESHPPNDPVLDGAVAQVLDILPDQSPDYIRYLLSHPDYPYKNNPERLIEALFEGAAPSLDEVEAAMAQEAVASHDKSGPEIVEADAFEYTKGRLNVFDEEKMDLTQVHVGKKDVSSAANLQDRAYMEQMKADILRRVAELSDSEEEDKDDEGGGIARIGGKGKDVAFEDELDDDGGVIVRDGEGTSEEGSSDDDDESGGEEAVSPLGPEAILELAYIRDPKLFDSDGGTRRSKARTELKAQTGWDHNQIEGWRSMLERDPKRKEKMLQRHEFSGNKPLAGPIAGPSGGSSSQTRGGRGGGRGRGGGGGGGGSGRGGGGGRGRGRGRGGHGGGEGGGGGGGDGGSARDRAYKDRRGNQKRKAGHDKKMAKLGGPSS